MNKSNIKVALVGNPNTGKTSLFNLLTGLNQQVGNYPGITVERKTGSLNLDQNTKASLIDLPGTYSLNPSSFDENVVTKLLLNRAHQDFPDVLLVVTEIENLKRNLLLFTQVKDLAIPTILVINMSDRMEKKGISIDIPKLEELLKTKIVLTSTRKGEGVPDLKNAILDYKNLSTEPCVTLIQFDDVFWKEWLQENPLHSNYTNWLADTHLIGFEENENKLLVSKIKRLQQKEIIKRYQFINQALKENYKIDTTKSQTLGAKLDRVLTHPIAGYLIFMVVLLMIFQAIFSWSEGAMDFIESSFEHLSLLVSQTLPKGMLTDLITQGIIAGIGGVVIFVPQIAFLFLFISLLEESGYMSRVVFLMDKIMRKFGLSGKSVVPLISGNACAIPAIMSTRNIENWKERLLTILVTPFTVCSARLPVYTIIIALIIPNEKLFGIFDYRGLTLMFMYVFGIVTAVLASYILNKIIKLKSKSYFVVEMPSYKVPMLKNVGFNVFEKTKFFVIDAGKIILSISIILWFLASFGPGENFSNAENIVKTQQPNLTETEFENAVAAHQLEHSYVGIMGRAIEPAIAPLGYDWKIGIAIITSFAAREVFVGTLGIIYSVGENPDDETNLLIRQKMDKEMHPKTGKKVFDFPTGMSLLFFYALAMQCIATLAIVKKETNSWKWPILQLVFMSASAYLFSFIVYQIFS
uniref:ferrous iron transport protein B n=1 Tax=Flavobacterium sp. TaxID=239 RepID=UPI004048F454